MQSQQDLEEKGLPEPCSPAWGEAPWIVDGVPVPADKLLASMRELDRRLKRTSNTVQPGTINGVAVPAELINKAMIEQGLIKPPPPPPKGIKN